MQLPLFGNHGARPDATPPDRGRGNSLGPQPRGGRMAGAAAGSHQYMENLRTDLFRRLSRLTGGRLGSLSLTDNRRTILSVRPARGGPIDLRIHRSFAAAPDPVLRAVAVFLESGRRTLAARQALAAIREHFQHHRPRALEAPSSPGGNDPRRDLGAGSSRRSPQLTLDQQGVALDLREVADDLNRRYFDGRLEVHITWGKSTGEAAHGHGVQDCRRSRTTSLQLGSYSYEDRLIRIHRVLDRLAVPRYVVESVVHHELLHADLPPVTRNGRRYFHTPEFRRREREFRHFERADRWVRENLQVLLRARREASRFRRSR